MKRALVLILFLSLILVCSKSKDLYNIECTVNSRNGNLEDSIYVEIFNFCNDPNCKKTKRDSLFEFNVKPGRYTIKVSCNGYEPFKENFVVPDAKTKLDILVKLEVSSNKGIQSSGKISGFAGLDQYHEIINLKRLFVEYPLDRDMYIKNPNAGSIIYRKVVGKFDSLSMQYDDFFQPLLAKYRLNILYRYHPFNFESGYLYEYRDENYDTLLSELLHGELFEDYLAEFIHALQRFDESSYLYENPFTAAQICGLDCYAELRPELMTKYHLNKDYFINYLINLSTETPQEEFGADLLFVAGQVYGKKNQFAKLVKVVDVLKNNFPNNHWVENGAVDRLLSQINLVEGCQAPEFSATFYKGKSFHLSDYKGQFVYLDFWATWCSGCRLEIPNMVNLSKKTSPEQLKIIGIMNDTEKNANSFFEEHKLPYDNVIANQDVINAYGIQSLPTTFLIGLDGKIIGKNLRGDNIIQLVSDRMKQYPVN